jgi:hypothetical protein
MTATIIRLERNPEVLWQRWMDARIAHMADPTPARFDACIEAFKPYWFRAVGLKHGRAAFEAQIEEERRRCNAFLVAAQRRAGGIDGGR